MSDEQAFLDWLEEQDYWISSNLVEEKWPDVEFRDMTGITMKPGWGTDGVDDDDMLVPRRDWRNHLKWDDR